MIELISICVNDLNSDSELKLKKQYERHYSDEEIKDIYYIASKNYHNANDWLISDSLGLTAEQYQDILIKCNGTRDFFGNFIFYSKEDCEKAIEELYSTTVMNTLKGGNV